MGSTQMKYIFLRKDEQEDGPNLSTPFIKMFDSLFDNVTENSFDIEYNKEIHTVNYKCSKKGTSQTCYLVLNIEGRVDQCAKTLNEVNNRLVKGIHRKDYYIILSFDGVSRYFCNKIYPKFNLFERKIRELIFCILVKALGIKWFEVTFPNELKKEIKEKGMNKSDLIEKSLCELTIYQLEMYLFTPRPEVNVNSIIESELGESHIKENQRKKLLRF